MDVRRYDPLSSGTIRYASRVAQGILVWGSMILVAFLKMES